MIVFFTLLTPLHVTFFMGLGLVPCFTHRILRFGVAYIARWVIVNEKLYLEDFTGYSGLLEKGFYRFYPDWMDFVFAFWVNCEIICYNQPPRIIDKSFERVSVNFYLGKLEGITTPPTAKSLTSFLDKNKSDNLNVCSDDRIKTILENPYTNFYPVTPLPVKKKIVDGLLPLAAWREYCDLTIEKISDVSGLSVDEIHAIECGVKVADNDRLIRLSSALGIFPGMIN